MNAIEFHYTTNSISVNIRICIYIERDEYSIYKKIITDILLLFMEDFNTPPGMY